MINERLFRHYGIDTSKDLKMTHRCPRPFDTVLIDKQGSCYACECQSWLPQSMGNLQIKPLAEILHSATHQELQHTIQDGSYRFCNENQCAYLRNRLWEMWDTTTAPARIRHIRLAIDDSCNLKCPSCRNSMIFHKSGSAYNRGVRLADRINDWLEQCEHPIKVHIGSDGDPFASLVYRHFMSHTPRRDNIQYSMLTNGLMLKEFHGTVPHVMSGLTDLGISIDGATKTTYEKLRLGGKWDKIQEALAFVSEAKRERGFNFTMHMVVQNDNWHEIALMLELAKRHCADKLYLNRIEDWNTQLDHSLQSFTEDKEFKTLLSEVSQDELVLNNVISEGR